MESVHPYVQNLSVSSLSVERSAGRQGRPAMHFKISTGIFLQRPSENMS